jgi:hypothetical protein
MRAILSGASQTGESLQFDWADRSSTDRLVTWPEVLAPFPLEVSAAMEVLAPFPLEVSAAMEVLAPFPLEVSAAMEVLAPFPLEVSGT